MSEITYYENPEQKLMYKCISATEIFLLQVFGRDLSLPFSHRHEKVVFPSAERLQQDLAAMKVRTAQDWEDLMNEYLQVNKSKLALVNEYRQRQYHEGKLKL